MRKYVHYLPLLIIVLVTGLLFFKVNQQGKDAGSYFAQSQMVGKKVPDIELKAIFPANGKLDDKAFKDKYTVINFFASWCIACLEEHKLLSEFKDNRKLRLVGIAWRDKKIDTINWLSKHGNPYKIVADDDVGKYGIMLGVTGIPETYLIDKQGNIVMHIRGVINQEDIDNINRIILEKK